MLNNSGVRQGSENNQPRTRSGRTTTPPVRYPNMSDSEAGASSSRSRRGGHSSNTSGTEGSGSREPTRHHVGGDSGGTSAGPEDRQEGGRGTDEPQDGPRTRINIRYQGEHNIPLYVGNITDKELFNSGVNRVSLNTWLRSLETYFRSEQITNDQEKLSKLLYHTHKTVGDAHQVLNRYLGAENANKTYSAVVAELKNIYSSEDIGTLYGAVKETDTYTYPNGNAYTPRNAMQFEAAGKKVAEAYLSRTRYNIDNDTRTKQQLLTEFYAFTLMARHYNYRIQTGLFDKVGETFTPDMIPPTLCALINDAKGQPEKNLYNDHDPQKVRFLATPGNTRGEGSDDRRRPRDRAQNPLNRTRSPSFSSGRPNKGNITCWKCGKVGHIKRDCRQNNYRSPGADRGRNDQGSYDRNSGQNSSRGGGRNSRGNYQGENRGNYRGYRSRSNSSNRGGGNYYPRT